MAQNSNIMRRDLTNDQFNGFSEAVMDEVNLGVYSYDSENPEGIVNNWMNSIYENFDANLYDLNNDKEVEQWGANIINFCFWAYNVRDHKSDCEHLLNKLLSFDFKKHLPEDKRLSKNFIKGLTFGDILVNNYAGAVNPNKIGVFIRHIHQKGHIELRSCGGKFFKQEAKALDCHYIGNIFSIL